MLRISRTVFLKIKYTREPAGDLVKRQVVVLEITRLETAFLTRSRDTDAAIPGPQLSLEVLDWVVGVAHAVLNCSDPQKSGAALQLCQGGSTQDVSLSI